MTYEPEGHDESRTPEPLAEPPASAGAEPGPLDHLIVGEIDVSHIVTEDDQPLDSWCQEKQERLLAGTPYHSWEPPGGPGRPFISAANVGVFHGVNMPPVVPDVFISLDCSVPTDWHEIPHRSYFIWEFGKPPDLALEVVSNDRGGEETRKPSIYAAIGVKWYIVYDPRKPLSKGAVKVFELQGDEYVQRKQSRIPRLNLGLAIWRGEFEGTLATWLRWTDGQGRLLPTASEDAAAQRERADEAEAQVEDAKAQVEDAKAQVEDARVQADAAEARAQAALERADALEAKLRELGLDPGAV